MASLQFGEKRKGYNDNRQNNTRQNDKRQNLRREWYNRHSGSFLVRTLTGSCQKIRQAISKSHMMKRLVVQNKTSLLLKSFCKYIQNEN
jgi:hypothetical protein